MLIYTTVNLKKSKFVAIKDQIKYNKEKFTHNSMKEMLLCQEFFSFF